VNNQRDRAPQADDNPAHAETPQTASIPIICVCRVPTSELFEGIKTKRPPRKMALLSGYAGAGTGIEPVSLIRAADFKTAFPLKLQQSTITQRKCSKHFRAFGYFR